MYPTYEHKEKCGRFGKLFWFATITSPLVCVYFFLVTLRAEVIDELSTKVIIAIFLLFVILMNGVIALVGSVFVIKVENNTLSLIFGNGILQKKIDIREIKAVKQFETKYQLGLFGKYICRDTKLYSIGNKNIVEIELQSGKKIQIGTDQPEELTQAIKSVIC